MARNKYGIIYIDLGEQDTFNTSIASKLSEETKKLLYSLCGEIKTIYADDVGVNTISKICFIRLFDADSLWECKAIGTIYTDDSGVGIIKISFIVGTTEYQLIVTENDVELYRVTFQV